ncbi:hypothetical protein EYF80_008224 [Liparis tanakae]|uniref:Uncharacterized protein n=1 Tax=Liparis tanakae TaxID=230148 RepID=A0A4Z2IW08_9TELE|nr:hypothetical protein EYF80_008224 [Liparis tanakae]
MFTQLLTSAQAPPISHQSGRCHILTPLLVCSVTSQAIPPSGLHPVQLLEDFSLMAQVVTFHKDCAQHHGQRRAPRVLFSGAAPGER